MFTLKDVNSWTNQNGMPIVAVRVNKRDISGVEGARGGDALVWRAISFSGLVLGYIISL